MGDCLGLLARRQDDGVMDDSGSVEATLERRQMECGDVAIGDDDGAGLRHERSYQRAGVGHQPGTDEDVVAPPGERNGGPLDPARLPGLVGHLVACLHVPAPRRARSPASVVASPARNAFSAART